MSNFNIYDPLPCGACDCDDCKYCLNLKNEIKRQKVEYDEKVKINKIDKEIKDREIKNRINFLEEKIKNLESLVNKLLVVNNLSNIV